MLYVQLFLRNYTIVNWSIFLFTDNSCELIFYVITLSFMLSVKQKNRHSTSTLLLL